MSTRIPIQILSEANLRQHWRARHRRASAQRSAVYLHLRAHWGAPPPLPLTFTLTRIAPRMLDDDNCQSGLKAVRDSCADWLAGTALKGNDRQEGLTWKYGQRRGDPREYAVEITLTAP